MAGTSAGIGMVGTVSAPYTTATVRCSITVLTIARSIMVGIVAIIGAITGGTALTATGGITAGAVITGGTMAGIAITGAITAGGITTSAIRGSTTKRARTV
jgi:hypothetical protein